jgi:hypothetical protein
MGGESTVGLAAGVQGREGVLLHKRFGCVGGEGLGHKLRVLPCLHWQAAGCVRQGQRPWGIGSHGGVPVLVCNLIK